MLYLSQWSRKRRERIRKKKVGESERQKQNKTRTERVKEMAGFPIGNQLVLFLGIKASEYVG